jgi:large subunit ribosomal protein L15
MNHKRFNIVNLNQLENVFENGDVIDEKLLAEKGMVAKSGFDLKILAEGKLTKNFTVRASNFSKAAKAKIEAVGGKCEIV